VRPRPQKLGLSARSPPPPCVHAICWSPLFTILIDTTSLAMVSFRGRSHEKSLCFIQTFGDEDCGHPLTGEFGAFQIVLCFLLLQTFADGNSYQSLEDLVLCRPTLWLQSFRVNRPATLLCGSFVCGRRLSCRHHFLVEFFGLATEAREHCDLVSPIRTDPVLIEHFLLVLSLSIDHPAKQSITLSLFFFSLVGE